VGSMAKEPSFAIKSNGILSLSHATSNPPITAPQNIPFREKEISHTLRYWSKATGQPLSHPSAPPLAPNNRAM
jgi:hypothetical protein